MLEKSMQHPLPRFLIETQKLLIQFNLPENDIDKNFPEESHF